MIFKKKSPEERFAEALARELEAQAKETLKRLPPEIKERIKLMEKNSEAWRTIDKRVERGEIKLYWRKVDDDLYIAGRETFHGFPFKRHGDYILLPSGLDEYMHQIPPMDIDWVQANAETWRPRPMASIRWLDEPVKTIGYDGWYDAYYSCIVEARDGRRFLASALECMLLEECDGKRTAHEVATRAAERYLQAIWPYIEKDVKEGRMSKSEAKKLIDEIPQNAYIGLAVLRALSLLI